MYNSIVQGEKMEKEQKKPLSEMQEELSDEQKKAVVELINRTMVYDIKLDRYGIPNKTAPYMFIYGGKPDRDSMIEGVVQYIKASFPDSLDNFRETSLRRFLKQRHYTLLDKARPYNATKRAH